MIIQAKNRLTICAELEIVLCGSTSIIWIPIGSSKLALGWNGQGDDW